MGNAQAIKTGDVQVMSAGTGIQHSEYNESKDEQVNFLQLWIFPEERGVTPRYDQKTFDSSDRQNSWQQLVRPHNVEGDGLYIHQNAYFYRIDLDAGRSSEYHINGEGNGVYFFVLEGSVQIGNEQLDRRDGIGIWEASSVDVKAPSDAQILAVEVPMKLPTY